MASFTPIVCHETGYVAHIIGKTAKHITATPFYKGCMTTGGSAGETPIHTNGCNFTFTQPAKESQGSKNTVQLTCPAGKAIQITHGGCTLTIHPVEVSGISYKTTTEQAPGSIGGVKHSITLEVKTTFPMTRHNSLCVLLSTNTTGELLGSATVFGTNFVGGAQVGITATGSIN